MWPTWPQVGLPNRSNIDVKIDKKIDASWDRFFEGFLKILGARMEPCWHPKGTQDASYLKSTENQKNFKRQWNFNDFWSSGAPSWKQKSINNRFKKGIKMGRYLGIDFEWILDDLGSQVGGQNRAKIDQKWHRKNNDKKKSAKMTKKSQQEAATTLDTTGPGPWVGSGGRCKPLLRGSKAEGLERRGDEN